MRLHMCNILHILHIDGDLMYVSREAWLDSLQFCISYAYFVCVSIIFYYRLGIKKNVDVYIVSRQVGMYLSPDYDLMPLVTYFLRFSRVC